MGVLEYGKAQIKFFVVRKAERKSLYIFPPDNSRLFLQEHADRKKQDPVVWNKNMMLFTEWNLRALHYWRQNDKLTDLILKYCVFSWIYKLLSVGQYLIFFITLTTNIRTFRAKYVVHCIKMFGGVSTTVYIKLLKGKTFGNIWNVKTFKN